MAITTNRREFLKTSAAGLAAVGGFASLGLASSARRPFEISLAQWSLHRTLRSGELDNLEFPALAKDEFGIDAVEFVNQFFMDKAEDTHYLAELKTRAEDADVRRLLVMCDGEGQLGDPDNARRQQAIENHFKWLEAAKLLGCHSIRVNAASRGGYQEQMELAADGLSRLGEVADQYGLNVLVENHGGLSSHGEWLAGVMEKVARPNVGTLPDFGNFNVGNQPGPDGEPFSGAYDRYQGVTQLMPYAKAVSAKTHEFNDQGEEVHTDFTKMMKIVLDAGYRGYVGVEWEGGAPGEYEGIKLTRQLLQRVRDELSS